MLNVPMRLAAAGTRLPAWRPCLDPLGRLGPQSPARSLGRPRSASVIGDYCACDVATGLSRVIIECSVL